MDGQQRVFHEQLGEMIQNIISQSMTAINELLNMGFQMRKHDQLQHEAYAKGFVAVISELSLLNEAIYYMFQMESMRFGTDIDQHGE